MRRTNDLASILKQFEIDSSRLSAELTRSLDKLKTGNARTPAISPTLLKMMTDAWTIGSIDYGAEHIRSGFTILALFASDDLARIVREIGKELLKIQVDVLKKNF